MNHRAIDDDEYELLERSEDKIERTSRKGEGLIAICNFTTQAQLLSLLPALFCSILAGLIHPIMSIFFGRIFDTFSGHGGGASSNDQLVGKSLTNTYGLIVIGLATWIIKGCFFGLWVIYGEMQAKTVRDYLFETLLGADLEWYECYPGGIGHLLVRLQTQIRHLQIGISQPLGLACMCTVQALASTGVAFYYNWKLALVILGAAVVMILLFTLAQMAMPEALRAYHAAQDSAAKTASHILNNISVIKCSNTQVLEVANYRCSIVEAARFYRRQALVNAFEIGVSRFGSTAIMVAGMYLGNTLVHQSKSTAQSIITTFWSCLATVQAVEDILPYLMAIDRARTAATALRAVLNHVTGSQNLNSTEQGICLDRIDGNVEIRNVSFSYPSRPDRLVLHQASFVFPAGRTTFVIGKSGSGKSTIGNLLLRYYEPRSGEIFIDNYNIKGLNINWLRNNIALVEQQSVLFNTTLSHNVAFGCPDPSQVTNTQVQQCSEFALLLETIAKLPDGLETKLDTSGSTLSGGQKQRVSVARARLRNAPILILDEPTSALDYATSTAIMRNIRSWRKGKTTIIITHDLTLMNDDDHSYAIFDEHAVTNGSPVSVPIASSRDQSGEELDRLEPATFLLSMSLQSSEHMKTIRALSYRLSVGATNILNNRRKLEDQVTVGTNDRRIIFGGEKSPRWHWSSMTIATGANSSRFSTSWLSFTGLRDIEPSRYATRAKAETLVQEQAVGTFQSKQSHSPHCDPDGRPFSLQKLSMTVWPSLSVHHRVVLLSGFLAAIIHAACTPLFSYVLAKLLTTFYLQEEWYTQARSYSLILIGIGIVDGLSSFFMHYLLEATGQRWVDVIRLRAVQRIVQQPKKWFDDPLNQSSVICSVLDRHADEMRNLLGRFAAPLCVVIVMITSSTVWALTLCWQLTFVGIASAPVLYGITKALNMVCNHWEARTDIVIDAINAVFVETFTKIRTVRALTLECWFHKKYTEATSQTLNAGVKRGSYGGLLYGLVDGALHIVTAAVFGYGAFLVKSGPYSVETILTVFSLLLFSTANANAIVAYIPQLTSSINAATHLLRLSEMPSTSYEDIGHIRPSRSELSGPIEFLEQNFTYPSRPEAIVLRNVTFTIPAAKCTAIVGASGSGKSTIASLLLGLYPSSPAHTSHTNGKPATLLLSGYDLRTLDMRHLRNSIAIVPQTPILIPGTVRDNILYGITDPQTSLPSRLETAAKAADIHNDILALPSGYDTIIGDGGLGLSGGQAQRIVIARALARNPQILVLDEATSALDHESADTVMRSIKRLIEKGKRSDGTRTPALTVIMITHAVEMMERADHVVVMKDGRAVEEGGYRELHACRGELWNMLRDGRGGL